MAKRIVVNAGFIETRVAVQEANLLTDLYVERAHPCSYCPISERVREHLEDFMAGNRCP